MNEPIQANVSLRCKLSQFGFDEPAVECVTELLARDCAVVLAGSCRAPRWLRLGREVLLSIALPSSHQRAPRILECGSVIARLEYLRQGFRVRLDIHRMAFLMSADETRRFQSAAVGRDREITKTLTQFSTIEREREMLFLKNLVIGESGQDMVEYGLVVALIALIVLAGVTAFGTNLNAGFTSINGKIATNVK